MKRVLILSAVLIIAATFSSFRPMSDYRQTSTSQFIFLVGSQTHFSLLANYEYTVWVTYNPATSTIMGVYAEDEIGNPVDVVSYSGDISSSGTQLYASNFRVNLSDGTPGDYVILDGALDMV